MERINQLIENRVKLDSVSERWVKIFNELGYAGAKKGRIYKDYDSKFGKEDWLPTHSIDGKLISRGEAYLVYEEAYYEFLRKNKDIRKWLVNTASEVYDLSPSNIKSGLDYNLQECTATHLQDISVRRVLTRLLLEERSEGYNPESLPILKIFRGDHPVKIREKDSEGYILNPGKVPFHMPEKILKTEQNGWWDRGTVEDWYQKNKVLLVNPEKLELELSMISPSSISFKFDESRYYSLDSGDPLSMRFVKGKIARESYCNRKNALVEVTGSPKKPYSEWINNLNDIKKTGYSKRMVTFEEAVNGK